jgi:hypothetical protein
MWIIKMKHVGKDNTYSMEEESATDEFWANIKYRRMLDRWHKILCSEVRVYNVDYTNDIVLKTIEFNLLLKNDGSTFEIIMEQEID